jgi:hypothetical protein
MLYVFSTNRVKLVARTPTTTIKKDRGSTQLLAVAGSRSSIGPDGVKAGNEVMMKCVLKMTQTKIHGCFVAWQD